MNFFLLDSATSIPKSRDTIFSHLVWTLFLFMKIANIFILLAGV